MIDSAIILLFPIRFLGF